MGFLPGVDDGFALYPLTVCDNAQNLGSMTKGWVVEGVVDVDKVRAAYDRVVAKWRMLAGRVVVRDKQAYMRVPLGDLPPSYEAYTFTSTESPVPLSSYTTLPMQPFTEVLPHHLFLPPKTPLKTYVIPDQPLVHWHITTFPHAGEEYSCIGMQYSHGVFDGLGSSFVVHALIAELAGKPWDVPLLGNPSAPAMHENPLARRMDEEVRARPEETLESASARIAPLSLQWAWSTLGFAWQMLWIKMWHGVGHYSVILPHRVHTKFVEEVREEAVKAGLTEVRLGVGDVLFAWIMKSIHLGPGENPNGTLGLWNQSTLRTEWDSALARYPHNCNVGQNLPIFTVRDAVSLPTSTLAYRLAQGRTSTPRREDAVRYWKIWEAGQKGAPWRMVVPRGKADETMTMSNVSMARVTEVDWSPAGGRKTLNNYVWIHTFIGGPVQFYIINGRLGNGDLVLTIYTTLARRTALEAEVGKLLKRYD